MLIVEITTQLTICSFAVPFNKHKIEIIRKHSYCRTKFYNNPFFTTEQNPA